MTAGVSGSCRGPRIGGFDEVPRGTVPRDAGIELAGIARNETLIVFKDAKAFDQFIEKGWEYAGGGAASAGVAGKSVGAGSGEDAIGGAFYYTLTKNGLQVGGAVAGTKFWQDKDLN
jgi:lipid-binding SYLF domain-containing protein